MHKVHFPISRRRLNAVRLVWSRPALYRRFCRKRTMRTRGRISLSPSFSALWTRAKVSESSKIPLKRFQFGNIFFVALKNFPLFTASVNEKFRLQILDMAVVLLQKHLQDSNSVSAYTEYCIRNISHTIRCAIFSEKWDGDEKVSHFDEASLAFFAMADISQI